MKTEQAEIKLDGLKIVILDHGEKVRQVEIPDARIVAAQWVESFNRDWKESGLEARVA